MTKGGSPRRVLAIAGTLLPVLLLTLFPGRLPPTDPLSLLCVICGWRGTSDAILNVGLLVPFGMALGAFGVKPRAALVSGLTLSLGIELAQMIIPNRNPGLGDVIYNGAGTALGAWAYSRREVWLGRGGRASDRLGAAWGWFGVALPFLLGVALVPALPDADAELQWTPETAYGDRYGGQVARFSIDEVVYSGGPVAGSGGPASMLREGARIDVSFTPAPPPDAIVPLVRLRRDRDDDFFVGIDGDDLILRYRTLGMIARLDRPTPRWTGATERWTEHDSVTLAIDAIGGGVRVESTVPSNAGESGAELTVPSARSWGLLSFPSGIARVAHRFDVIWMFLLAVPLGLWATTRSALVLGVGWVVALYAAPWVFPVLSATHVAPPALVGGLAVGATLRRHFGNLKTFS